MAFKLFETPDIGTVTVYKRRGVGSLRLSVRHDGQLRVTVPSWMSFQAGLDFARSRQVWIDAHRPAPTTPLAEGMLVGKGHRLRFRPSSTSGKPSGRLTGTEIVVSFPASSDISDGAVQHAARRACLRALRHEAEKLLPLRLQELSRRYALSYSDVVIKQLTSRWGSCDQDKHIALSLYLMLLPWELIDYVLLHELTHTRIMKHGPEFWRAMEAYDPRTPQHRKTIRSYKPSL